MRFRGVDFVKGILIFLVIVGHVLLGKTNESLLRHIIYFFHMPLFIGISGYIINTEKIKTLSLTQLFNKYLLRLVIPWIFAVIIYSFYLNFSQIHNLVNLKFWLTTLFTPFYHLWFIPAYLSWVIIEWFFLKSKIKFKYQLFLVLLVSGVSSLLVLFTDAYPSFLLFKFTDSLPSKIESILFVSLNLFRPQFLFFFILGIWFKTFDFKQHINKLNLLLISCLPIIVFLYYFRSDLVSFVLFFIFNSLLLSIVVHGVKANVFDLSPKIESIGINSLFLYLYHVIPILIIKNYISINNTGLYYAFVIAVELVFVFIVQFLYKRKLISRCLGGIQ